MLWNINAVISHSLCLYLPISTNLKLLNINIIQDEYGLIIDQTYNIIKKIIQKYWGTKTKYEVKFQKSPSPADTYFEISLFISTPLIREELKQNLNSHWGFLNHWIGSLMQITFQTHWSSIPYHLSQWIYECPRRACIPCYQTRHGISHVSTTQTYHVSKKGKNSKQMEFHTNTSSKKGMHKLKK